MGLFSKLFGKKKDDQSFPQKNEGNITDKSEKPVDEKPHSSLHDSLQQWANDNQRDIEEDDSTPLRSGL